MEIKLNSDGQIETVFKPKSRKTEIIGLLLKKSVIEDKINKLNWASQIKILNKLQKKYKEDEFWTYLIDNLGFKLNNLAYFLTPDGKTKILGLYNKFKFSESIKIEENLDLESEPVYTKETKPVKIKSLMDFLK